MKLASRLFLDVARGAVSGNRDGVPPVKMAVYKLANDLGSDKLPDNVMDEIMPILQTLAVITPTLGCPGDIKYDDPGHEPTYVEYTADIMAEIKSSKAGDPNLTWRAIELVELLEQFVWPYSA